MTERPAPGLGQVPQIVAAFGFQFPLTFGGAPQCLADDHRHGAEGRLGLHDGEVLYLRPRADALPEAH
ncbi:hypothetical protein GCM10027075_39270 [Streptomyces heilongjiangensis]